MYKIRYNYDTGDSFTTHHGLEEFLELTWEKREVAEANLKRLQEHYVQYQGVTTSSYRRESTQSILFKNMNKDWFVNEPKAWVNMYKNLNRIDNSKVDEWKAKGCDVVYLPDETMATNCVVIYTDDDKPFQMWAPYCGYFNHLNSLEVVQENLRVTF